MPELRAEDRLGRGRQMMMQIDKERFNEALEIMCDDFCHWPVAATSDEQLKSFCNDCPLNNIECDDYWEEKEKNG